MTKQLIEALQQVAEAADGALHILAASARYELTVLGVYTTKEAGLESLRLAEEELEGQGYIVDLFTLPKEFIDAPYEPYVDEDEHYTSHEDLEE